jgi:hypothetical protein
MTYREKLARIMDHEVSLLLVQAGPRDLDKLEQLCRCAKILAGEEPGEPPEPSKDESELLSIAER